MDAGGHDELTAGWAALDADPRAAARVFARALGRDPGNADALHGLGAARLKQRRLADARALLERARAAGADPDRIAADRWTAAMLAGDFEAAWTVSDGVLARRSPADRNRADVPFHLRQVWDGSPLAGRHVLVRCYHGLGDAIQFIRYVPLLARRAAGVTVQADASLHGLLLASGFGRVVPLAGDAPDPPFEADIELMELPHALRTTLADIPNRVPYLAAPDRARPRDGRLHVGIAWAAGAWNPGRSIPFAELAPLFAVPGVRFHNLQRGPAAAALGPGALSIFADGPSQWSDDIVATAALIRALDAVISVDTMVAHLAGALGTPVWTLLKFDADWRWLTSRTDSPWYPTMRLFRQARPQDWSAPLAQVRNALAAAAAGLDGRAPGDQ